MISGISLDTNWRHIAGLFDADKNETGLFVDGELTATGPIDTDGSNNSVNIRRNPLNQDYRDGKISEARIYHRSLTQSEVQYLHNVGKRWYKIQVRKLHSKFEIFLERPLGVWF